MKSAYVTGEALIDLITFDGSSTAHVGGGPANTAKALARMGFDTCFVGGISTDQYGGLIESELLESGVDLSCVLRGDLPTALARALIDANGVASYEFELVGSITFAFSSEWLPSDSADVIHMGSVATLVEPGAKALLEWVSDTDSVVVFDPNVRPSIQGDVSVYRAAVERFVAVADVVKLSDDDLNWLYCDSETEVVNRWISAGVSLVVVTLGAAGLRAYRAGSVIEIPGVEIDLVDSVGAGDTIGAVLAEGVLLHDLSGMLDTETLTAVLRRAVKAAAITCSRAGANPPWKDEL